MIKHALEPSRKLVFPLIFSHAVSLLRMKWHRLGALSVNLN